MNKILEEIKENSKVHYGILIIIGILLSIPLIQLQLRQTHDGALHVLRLIGMDTILKIGEFPPIINPDFCRGFGYAINLFYPPLVTYVPMLLKGITHTFSACLKLFAALTIIFSGIMMYQCTRQITKNKVISLISSILYMLIPYKLESIFTRFAIGEFTAYVFIPVVFLGLHNLLQEDGKKHYYLVIGAVGLLLSHTITSVYTAFFCLVYILIYCKKINKKIIQKGCVDIVLILLISAFFIVPLLEHRFATEYAIYSPEMMRTDGVSVTANTINLWQLFKDKGEVPGVSFLVGVPILLLLLLGIFTRKKLNENYKEFYLISILFAIISLFMCTRWFPWTIMPGIFTTIQYPWRMLAFFGFFLSIVCAVHLENFIQIAYQKETKKNLLLLISIFLILFLSYPTLVRYYKEQDLQLDENYEKNIIAQKTISHMQINRDYLPLKAIKLQKSYMVDRKMNCSYIMQGNVTFINERKEEGIYTATIEKAEEGSKIELPYLYYLGYQVKIKQEEKEIEVLPKESDNGFLEIAIPEKLDNASIEVKYVGTVWEKIAYLLSAIGIILFIIERVYSYKKERKIEGTIKKVGE